MKATPCAADVRQLHSFVIFYEGAAVSQTIHSRAA